MDPFIWGPLLWNILEDCCYSLDTQNVSQRHQDMFIIFAHSLTYLLPCVYCRNSYSKFIKVEAPEEYIKIKNLSQWVFNIHNLVNKKLNKQSNITFKKFQKRLQVQTSRSTHTDIIDFTNILILNYDVKQHPHKREWMFYFFNTLPAIIDLIPHANTFLHPTNCKLYPFIAQLLNDNSILQVWFNSQWKPVSTSNNSRCQYTQLKKFKKD